jgi:hypothetical protein
VSIQASGGGHLVLSSMEDCGEATFPDKADAGSALLPDKAGIHEHQRPRIR